MKRAVTVFILIPLILTYVSCHKLDPNPNPLPVWEDLSSDSVTINATMQTVSGHLLTGQYLNYALSQDSLNKGILIRSIPTDSKGIAIARKLYPRRYFISCVATYQSKVYSGSYVINTKPSQRIDTLLLVY